MIKQEVADYVDGILRKNQSCSTCKNAIREIEDCRYRVICSLTGENRKGKTGFMCNNYEESEGFVGNFNH